MNIYLRNKYLGFGFAIAIILLSHVYTFFYFPPAEGWWQVYAYLYNKGYRLYYELNLPFPPLFVIYNSILLKISNLYIVYRVLGILQVLVIFFMLYLSLRKYYAETVSLAGASFGVLMSIYNVVYLPNDYHTTESLFIIISLYFFLAYQDRRASFIRRFFAVFLSSIFLIGTFFLKQNIGLVLIVSCILSAIVSLVKARHKSDLYLFVFFLTLLSLSYITYISLLQMSALDVFQLTIGNDSKGNILTVITRIIADENNRMFLVKGGLYLPLLIIYPYIKNYYKKIFSDYIWVLGALLFIFLSVIFFRNPEDSSVLIVIVYLYWLIYALFFKGEYDVLMIPLLSLVYANSMTAGLCVGGLFLVMPFAMGYLFKELIADDDRLRGEYLYYPFIIILFFSLYVYKQKEPYNWWGLRQGEISQAKYILPYPELKYISVDKATYDIFYDIKQEIDQKSKYINDVYLYPDIPIFYQLHHKNPPTNNIVQWYDVISTAQFNEDFIKIKNEKPRIIIILDQPWFVYQGHALLKQSRLPQKDFMYYMDQQVALGVYRMVKYQIYDNDLFGDKVNGNKEDDISLVVSTPSVLGKTIDELYDDGYLYENYDIYDLLSRSCHVKDITQHKLLKGDRIFVKLKYSQINQLVCKIGAPDISSNKKYVLKIYEINGI